MTSMKYGLMKYKPKLKSAKYRASNSHLGAKLALALVYKKWMELNVSTKDK